MAKYRITAPDGQSYEITAPDNASQDEVMSYAIANFSKPAPQPKPKEPNTMGDLAAGLVRGAGSIGATILAPIDIASDLIEGRGLSLQSNRERRQKMTDALTEFGADPSSMAFRVGQVGGEIAGTAGVGPALAIPATGAKVFRAAVPAIGAVQRAAQASPMASQTLLALQTSGAAGGNLLARSAGGAISGGAAAALVDPSQAGTGAAIGGAFPVVTKAAGAFGSRVANTVRPEPGPANALAQKAVDQYRIPLGVADVSGSNFTKAMRSVLNDAPGIGAIGAAQREGVQEGFNKAVGATFGAGEAKLTPKVMDEAKARMGAEFDRIWNGNVLTVDDQFMSKVIGLQRAAAKLPANEGGSLSREIDDILSKVQQTQAGELVIPGDVANKFQSYLRRRAEGSAGLRNELSDLRQTIIGAFNRSVSPEDAAALTKNRAQYKAFKTVEPILNSAEAGVAGRVAGDVPAGLLPSAVLKSYGNAAGTELGDLSQIGSQFIADRVARTGGSTRAMIQNSMLGGALGAGAFANPLLAAGVIPVAAGANWALGNPTLGRIAAQQRNALALPVTAYRAAPMIGTGQ